MNNTKSLMIGMRPKDAIKIDIVNLDKSETYPEENVIPEDILFKHLYQTCVKHEDQKR